jgi:Holliday junction resolvasome RuvABC DNA-binding subunit
MDLTLCILVSMLVSLSTHFLMMRYAANTRAAGLRLSKEEGEAKTVIVPAVAPVKEVPAAKKMVAHQREKLATALTGLGWKRAEVQRCIEAFGSRADREELPVLVKEAIGRLAS